MTTEGFEITHVVWETQLAIKKMDQLSPLAELALRRICDLIYIHKNQLLNDDATLARMTKTGRKWKSVKIELIKHDAIYIADDYIRVEKCDLKFTEIGSLKKQRQTASRKGVQARKKKKIKGLEKPNDQSNGQPKHSPPNNRETDIDTLPDGRVSISEPERNRDVAARSGGAASTSRYEIDEILDRAIKFSPDELSTWGSELRAEGFRNGKLLISVPTMLVYNFLKTNRHKLLPHLAAGGLVPVDIEIMKPMGHLPKRNPIALKIPVELRSSPDKTETPDARDELLNIPTFLQRSDEVRP